MKKLKIILILIIIIVIIYVCYDLNRPYILAKVITYNEKVIKVKVISNDQNSNYININGVYYVDNKLNEKSKLQNEDVLKIELELNTKTFETAPAEIINIHDIKKISLKK